jgi:hypothetical protein
MRFAPLLSLPPIAPGIAVAVWMSASAPRPAQVEGRALDIPDIALTTVEGLE